MDTGDDRYDEALHTYNAVHDSTPTMVVRPVRASDVAWALERVRRDRLEVAVKGGGHSLAGYGASHGGMLIDLAGLDWS